MKPPSASRSPGPIRETRELITPEGVDLQIELGSASRRFAALAIDFAILLGVIVALTVGCFLVGALEPTLTGSLTKIVWLLGFFLLRNGWFLAFELSPRAATPGKRMMGLRVAARSGGRLTVDAVFARNAMREIELFLPLTFLAMNAASGDGWTRGLGLLWSGIFTLFPLFNRDRLRVGDLVAGTWVVREPRRKLAADLGEAASAEAARYAFSKAQLDAYGIKELQVLEDVLRRGEPTPMRIVAQRIRNKIDWSSRPDETDRGFLDAYYAALRGRLEANLLMGKRRRDKHDAA